MDKHKPSITPTTQPQEQFNKAVDRLHEEHFRTELWIEYKTQQIVFRWVKKGAKWHISARGLNHLNTHLEMMGRQAIHWCEAREHGTAKEENYAVHEI
jgi:hypothetical protein